jgi:hypothetical protein
MNMKRLAWKQMAFGGLTAIICVIAGASISTTKQAHGETRGAPEPPAFQSGGQLSVPILREISATLRQMDARLARLEVAAQRMQASPAGRGGQPPRNAGAAN